MEGEWNHTLSVWNEGFGIFHHRESYQHSEVFGPFVFGPQEY